MANCTTMTRTFVTKEGKKVSIKAKVKQTKGCAGCEAQWGPKATPTNAYPNARPNAKMLKTCMSKCKQ